MHAYQKKESYDALIFITIEKEFIKEDYQHDTAFEEEDDDEEEEEKE